MSMWLKKITLRHAEHEGTLRKPLVKLSGLSGNKLNTETRRSLRNTENNFYIQHFTLDILYCLSVFSVSPW